MQRTSLARLSVLGVAAALACGMAALPDSAAAAVDTDLVCLEASVPGSDCVSELTMKTTTKRLANRGASAVVRVDTTAVIRKSVGTRYTPNVRSIDCDTRISNRNARLAHTSTGALQYQPKSDARLELRDRDVSIGGTIREIGVNVGFTTFPIVDKVIGSPSVSAAEYVSTMTPGRIWTYRYQNPALTTNQFSMSSIWIVPLSQAPYTMASAQCEGEVALRFLPDGTGLGMTFAHGM